MKCALLRGRTRRLVVIVFVASLLGMATIGTAASPAGALTCTQPLDGTWIGNWNTTTAPNFAGAWQSTLHFASDGSGGFTDTGSLDFVTGSTFLFSTATTVSPVTCDTATGLPNLNVSLMSSGGPVAINVNFSADGTQVSGTFTGTQPGNISGAAVQNPVFVSNGTNISTGTGTTSSNPVQASVISPTAGPLTIGEATAPSTTSSGYYVLNQAVQILAPPGTTSAPLTVQFEVDDSQLPAPPDSLAIFHDGVQVQPCVAVPPAILTVDPCVVVPSDALGSSHRFTIYSSSVSVWTFGVIPHLPSVPTSASAAPGNAQATVHWTKPFNSGGPPIINYLVTPYIKFAAQTPLTFAASTTSATIGSLTNAKTYSFKVQAINSVGAGPAFSTNVVTVGAPTAPRSVSATRGHKQAKLTWVAPASNNGASVTKYVITPFKGGVAQPSITINPATSKTITGLTTGKHYTFKVAAKNARGIGPQSVVSNSVTPT